ADARRRADGGRVARGKRDPQVAGPRGELAHRDRGAELVALALAHQGGADPLERGEREAGGVDCELALAERRGALPGTGGAVFPQDERILEDPAGAVEGGGAGQD